MTALAVVRVANRLGATVLEDNTQWKNRMRIRSASSSREYIVAQNKSNLEWGCSCMGWKRYRRCKHLTAMVPQLEAAIKMAAVGSN